MKVRAKTNIKYGNGWYAAGEEIWVSERDLVELEGLVEALKSSQETESEATFPTDETKQEPEKKPTRRPRKKAE